MTQERFLKLIVEQQDGVRYEVIAPTLNDGETIAGVLETVLRFSGNFDKMPDYVTVNGEVYIPA